MDLEEAARRINRDLWQQRQAEEQAAAAKAETERLVIQARRAEVQTVVRTYLKFLAEHRVAPDVIYQHRAFYTRPLFKEVYNSVYTPVLQGWWLANETYINEIPDTPQTVGIYYAVTSDLRVLRVNPFHADRRQMVLNQGEDSVERGGPRAAATAIAMAEYLPTVEQVRRYAEDMAARVLRVAYYETVHR